MELIVTLSEALAWKIDAYKSDAVAVQIWEDVFEIFMGTR